MLGRIDVYGPRVSCSLLQRVCLTTVCRFPMSMYHVECAPKSGLGPTQRPKRSEGMMLSKMA